MKEEIFERNVHYSCDMIELNEKNKLILQRNWEEDLTNKKKYILSLALYIENNGLHYITTKFFETIQFREELILFMNGDSQNQFLSPVKRTVNNEELKSLKLKKFENLNIYFSQAQSKAISKLIDYALNGFSLTKVYDQEKTTKFLSSIPTNFVKDVVYNL